MQDLTPQLRTRLGRVERAVGLFVVFATLLLLAGFGYYVYHTAKRKGWFDTKVVYCTTLPNSAVGLKVGDPVKLMGFDVGEITRIDAQPPDDLFNVYVEFEVRAPYHGYLWTAGSRVRVSPSDFLGNRIVEVTKGTNYLPTHLSWEIREYTPAEAMDLVDFRNRLFLQAWDLPGATSRVAAPLQLLDTNALAQLQAAGVPRLQVVNRAAPTKVITAVWDIQMNRYEPYSRKTKPYWLPPDESPALTDRLDDLVRRTADALPGLMALTNQLAQILNNTVEMTERANALLAQGQPVLTNLAVLTSNLTAAEGGLGRWLLPPELNRQLLSTLASADGTLTNATLTLTNASGVLTAASTNFAVLIGQLQPPLDNLSIIISNLNTQVQANTNFVTTLQDLLIHTDELIQGFKRHWFLRGAFKQKPTNAPPPTVRKRYETPKGALR